MYFFFFQAEDGIRDLTVTGVQTCALPISEAVRELLDGGDKVAARRVLEAHSDSNGVAQAALIQLLIADSQLDLAEERLSATSTAITADDRAALRLVLARARIGRGELGRAAAALGDGSRGATNAQRGWVRV